MNVTKCISRNLYFILSIILFNSCAVTVPFSYIAQSPVATEKKVVSNIPIYFTVTDKRPEPDIIGYMDNTYGMRMKKIKPADLDISKSIITKYREDLGKLGFVFSETKENSPLKLEFTVTSFLGEMRPGMINLVTNATCCMKILLSAENENKTLLKGSVCGKGEKKTPVVAGKKDIPAALSVAVDEVLTKIVNETELINQINNYKK